MSHMGIVASNPRRSRSRGHLHKHLRRRSWVISLPDLFEMFHKTYTGFTCPTATVRQIAFAYERHTARVCEIHLLRRTILEPNILSLSGPCRSGPFLLVPCLSGPYLSGLSLHFFLLTVFCLSGPCLPGPCLDRDRDMDQGPGPGPGPDRLTGWMLRWWAGAGRRVGR